MFLKILCIFLISSLAHAKAPDSICEEFLGLSTSSDPWLRYNFPKEYWPSSPIYHDLDRIIDELIREQSVAKLVTLSKKFSSTYFTRYDQQLESLVRAYPELNSDLPTLREALRPFQQEEQNVLTKIKQALFNLPAKKRMQFLRRKKTVELKSLEPFLDVLFGLSLDANAKSTSWTEMLRVIEDMDFGNTPTVTEIGSGHGQLGLLLGLLSPEVRFYALETNKAKAFAFSEAARKNGMLNVKFLNVDFEDSSWVLPQANLYFVFNPTNPSLADAFFPSNSEYQDNESANVAPNMPGFSQLTERFIELSQKQRFNVFALTPISYRRFNDYFYRQIRSDYIVYLPKD